MKLKSSTGKDIQVALLSSHTIVVTPEGVDVPKMFQAEAFRCGCVPVEVVLEHEDKPMDSADKTAAVVEAMKAMLEEGCTLTGSGLPNLNDLAVKVGFRVTKPEAHEAWNVLEAETK